MNAKAGSLGVDLLLAEWEATPPEARPHCAHGPLLLFAKWFEGGRSRKFWACAFDRSRKLCPAFCWDDAKRKSPANAVHPPWAEHESPKQHAGTEFCIDCQHPVPGGDSGETCPASHRIVSLQDASTGPPTELLAPLATDSSNAQYFFADSTVQLVLDQLCQVKAGRVLCIGAPRIHEAVLGRGKAPCSQSYLLDLDSRFRWFWGKEHFGRYNMATDVMIDGGGPAVTEAAARIVGECGAVVVDPPFGIQMAALARTLRRLWQRSHRCGSCLFTPEGELPTFLFFPYFSEKDVTAVLPTLRMTDYAADYTNHARYHNHKAPGGGRASPVRLYTNVPLDKVVLPAAEGYRLCQPCNRYVSRENEHCFICQTCPSKDGRPYRHCDKCGICVKASRMHCDTCGRCQPREHDCHAQRSSGRCHICGSTEHKRSWHFQAPASESECSQGAVDTERPAPKRLRFATAEGWQVKEVPLL